MAIQRSAVWLKYLHLPLAAVLSLVMVGVAAGMIFSLVAALIGPVWGFLVGLVGFVLGLAGYLYSDRWFIPACPQGLAFIIPSLANWRRPLDIAARTVVTVAFVALATLAVSARFDGHLVDAGVPVFAPRESYAMTHHAKVTPISKLRYWTIGTSCSLAWHSLGLFFALAALHGLLSGERLKPAGDSSAPVTPREFSGDQSQQSSA